MGIQANIDGGGLRKLGPGLVHSRHYNALLDVVRRAGGVLQTGGTGDPGLYQTAFLRITGPYLNSDGNWVFDLYRAQLVRHTGDFDGTAPGGGFTQADADEVLFYRLPTSDVGDLGYQVVTGFAFGVATLPSTGSGTETFIVFGGEANSWKSVYRILGHRVQTIDNCPYSDRVWSYSAAEHTGTEGNSSERDSVYNLAELRAAAATFRSGRLSFCGDEELPSPIPDGSLVQLWFSYALDGTPYYFFDRASPCCSRCVMWARLRWQISCVLGELGDPVVLEKRCAPDNYYDGRYTCETVGESKYLVHWARTGLACGDCDDGSCADDSQPGPDCPSFELPNQFISEQTELAEANRPSDCCESKYCYIPFYSLYDCESGVFGSVTQGSSRRCETDESAPNTNWHPDPNQAGVPTGKIRYRRWVKSSTTCGDASDCGSSTAETPGSPTAPNQTPPGCPPTGSSSSSSSGSSSGSSSSSSSGSNSGSSSSGSSSNEPRPECLNRFHVAEYNKFCCASEEAYFETDDFLTSTWASSDPYAEARRSAIDSWDGKMDDFGVVDGGIGRHIPFTWSGNQYKVVISIQFGHSGSTALVWRDYYWTGSTWQPMVGSVLADMTGSSGGYQDCCRIRFSKDYWHLDENDDPTERQIVLKLKNNRCCDCSNGTNNAPDCSPLPGSQRSQCGDSETEFNSFQCEDNGVTEAECPCDEPPDLPGSIVVTGDGMGLLVYEGVGLYEGTVSTQYAYLEWIGRKKWVLHVGDDTFERNDAKEGCYSPLGDYGGYTLS
jgi:uncharacterized membrane protein YgcG